MREAEYVLKLVVKMNVVSKYYHVYNATVEGYYRSGMVVKPLSRDSPYRFKAYIQQFAANGWKLSKNMGLEAQYICPCPCLRSYNILLDGLCLNCHLEEAFSFMRMMEDQGVNPDMVKYGTPR